MSKRILWIDCKDFSVYEKTLVTVLRGVVNRSGANIFLTTGKQSWINDLTLDRVKNDAFPEGFIEKHPTTEHIWMDILSGDYGYEFIPTTLKYAIRTHRDSFKGLLKYDDFSRKTIAPTACGIFDILPVNDIILSEYGDVLKGFSVCEDFSGMFETELQAQEYCVRRYLSRTTDEFVSSYYEEAESGTYQNDYAIMKRAFCYDLNHVTKTNAQHAGEEEAKSYNPGEENLLLPILDHVKTFGFLWGWGRGGENAIAAITAERGIVLLCANVPNASFFAGIEVKNVTLKQDHIDKNVVKPQNKMYIAFMTNECDTFKAAASFWNEGSWTNTAAHRELKINWGIDGLVFRLFPFFGEYYYGSAVASDYFFSATTTYGYVHPDFLRKDLIWDYAGKVKQVMEYSDTKYLDPWWFSIKDESGAECRWEWAKRTGAEGITQWSNRNETTYEPGFPVISSELYYPMEKAGGITVADRAQTIANTIRNAREKQPSDRPYCTVVYGGDPYTFQLIMDALPDDGFEAVRLDELFAIAEAARRDIEGLRAEYDLKGSVGTWDPTNGQ